MIHMADFQGGTDSYWPSAMSAGRRYIFCKIRALRLRSGRNSMRRACSFGMRWRSWRSWGPSWPSTGWSSSCPIWQESPRL